MSKLLHPGTKFIQEQPYAEVALGDMPIRYQRAVWRFMYAEGEGLWGEYSSVSLAVQNFGDVRFGIGSFANDETMKRAFVACLPDDIDVEDGGHIAYFDERFVGHDCKAEPIPVFLARADIAPEFGLLDDGHIEFYDYWVKQPRTEFVCVLPDWNPDDTSGRGGQ